MNNSWHKNNHEWKWNFHAWLWRFCPKVYNGWEFYAWNSAQPNFPWTCFGKMFILMTKNIDFMHENEIFTHRNFSFKHRTKIEAKFIMYGTFCTLVRRNSLDCFDCFVLMNSGNGLYLILTWFAFGNYYTLSKCNLISTHSRYSNKCVPCLCIAI